MRQLKRLRLRAYNIHGRSDNYLKLKSSFDEKSKIEFAKYKRKVELEVTEGRRGSSYPVLKRLGMRPGEANQTSFHLPGHAEQNLSSAQSAEIIAEHFSKISQAYSPLDLSSLAPNVNTYLQNCDQSLAPILSTHDVYCRMIKAKKPNGLVPGDLPKKLVQHCASTLATPAAIIFNQITRCAEYPNRWKVEHQIALPKLFPPETEDQLRNIAKTPFLSKLYESFVGGWLLPKIKPFLR